MVMLTYQDFFLYIKADVLRKNMGQPLEKYKEVDIYENDIPAKKETKI